MVEKLFRSRTVKVVLVALVIVLIAREAIDFASYPDHPRPQPATADGPAGSPQLIVTAQPGSSAPAAPPSLGPSRPQTQRGHNVVSHGTRPGAFPPHQGAHPAQPRPCGAEASESQIMKMLEQIARLKMQDPKLEPALIRIEAELSRATAGQACLAHLQEAVKSLCAADPKIEEAFKALERSLPLLVRVLAGDPCNQDLGAFLNLLERLNPDL